MQPLQAHHHDIADVIFQLSANQTMYRSNAEHWPQSTGNTSPQHDRTPPQQ